MAQHKTLLCALVLFAGVSHALGACGGEENHPQNLPTEGGSGSGGSGGGSGGVDSSTGGAGFGGFGGKKDSSSDAPKDVALDGNGGTDAQSDAPVDALHCTNGTKDEDESDQDCGGAVCPGCDVGKICGVDSDCDSKKCNTTTNTCNAPLCTDGVKNGSETDTDCGGTCTQKCGDGKGCAVGPDCTSGICGGTPMVCQIPSCTDGTKNGTETDIDCGGSCAKKCGLGQSCKATADCSSANCQTLQCKCPAGMVLAPSTGGGAYCIDQYEVTYEQYAIFWQANPAGQSAECSTWNTSYTPPLGWPALPALIKYPVRHVDWCDAAAYCKYVGRRLCGAQAGGPVAYASFADHTQSQWMNACTAGVNTYPYSGPYDPAKCISKDYQGPPLVEGGFYVPLLPLPGTRNGGLLPPQVCQGASPLLYDMSGNAAEWEDSCDGTTGATDSCHVRGGSFQSTQQSELACAANRTLARNGTADDIGIRCCYP